MNLMFKVILVVLLASSGACGDSIARARLEANLPVNQKEFKAITQRGLKQYFSEVVGLNVIVDYDLLRDAPTQSGLAYPKFYAWVTVSAEQSTVTSGAVRIAAIEGTSISVTDFFSRQEINDNPKDIESVFPVELCDGIRQLATEQPGS